MKSTKLDSFQLGPVKVMVCLTNQLPSDIWGRYVADKRLIELPDHISEVDLTVSFIHEMIHAVAEIWSLELDERTVTSLGYGISQGLFGIGFEIDWGDGE